MAHEAGYNHAAAAKRPNSAPPDPRLAELVKLLARDAAKTWLDAQMTNRSTQEREDRP